MIKNNGPNESPLPTDGDGGSLRKMLNEKQVLAILPVGRSTLWRMCAAGQFPKATHIATNRRIWFEDEVIAWQNEVNGRRP
jgi:predicted DNA-binding transcriptional regulator AlpA